MRDIVLIAHDIRSTHNIGSLLRTADGFGVKHLYMTGYTPYPQVKNDDRLPYIAQKLTKQISKTALGAEQTVTWSHCPDIRKLLSDLSRNGYQIIALEQDSSSIKMSDIKFKPRTALILGREVEGIEKELLALADVIAEIPMYGKKESFNVVQAAAIGLYVLRET